jgi:predicted O-methyltransferase YrrM
MKIGAYVHVVVGDSANPNVVREVRAALAGEPIGLLVIDYNGNPYDDVQRYLDVMAPGSYVIVDDYFSPGAPHKVDPVRSAIRALEERGTIESLGVFGWGTWVGRLLRTQ